MASDMRQCAGGNFRPVPTQPYDATAGSRQICPCFVLLLTRFFPKQLERPSATTPRHSHEGKLTELETQPHRRDSLPLAALAESPPPLSPSKEQAHSNKFWMHHGHSWSPSKERSPFQQLWAPVPANAAAGCSKKTPWSPWSPWAPSKERIAPAILDAGSSNRRSKSTHPRSGSSKSRCWFQQISTPVPTLTQHNLYPLAAPPQACCISCLSWFQQTCRQLKHFSSGRSCRSTPQRCRSPHRQPMAVGRPLQQMLTGLEQMPPGAGVARTRAGSPLERSRGKQRVAGQAQRRSCVLFLSLPWKKNG